MSQIADIEIVTDTVLASDRFVGKVRVIVTGGRTYSNGDVAAAVLNDVRKKIGISALAQGGARGADALARTWACRHLPPRSRPTYHADWIQYGNAAGAIRNTVMLKHFEPHLVIAFPGNTGTADMVSKARKAGVPILHIALDGETHFEFPLAK